VLLSDTYILVRLNNGEYRLTDNRPTVVFADDNMQVTHAALTLLDSKYKVISVAVNGEEAIHHIGRLRPDFAVLDISMPKMDGIAVARQLRQIGSNTRVVFVTLIDDEDYVAEAKSIGHGYVLKRRMSFDLLQALASAGNGEFFCSR
jgi:DNA-binding NarL/FixJ family response regulator